MKSFSFGLSYSLIQILEVLISHETKSIDHLLQLVFNTTYRNKRQKGLNHAVPILNCTFMTVISPTFLNRNLQFRKLFQSKINSSIGGPKMAEE